MRKVALLLLISGVALVASAPLHASPAGPGIIPENLSDKVRYRVSGTITASCSLVQDVREVAILELQDPGDNTVRATRTDLPFTIQCNTPVTVSMRSHHGGLKTAALTSDPDFSDLVRYRASLDLPGAPSALECASDNMAQALCSGAVGSGIYEGAGQVRVQTRASGSLLLAGEYRDLVTVTISPQLSGGQGEDD